MDRNVIVAQVSTGVSLRLYLFGRFRLEDAQRPIPLPTRKVEALLAYLALHPEVHAREKLAALLWGDYPDAQARASLRNALAILRKLIGDELLLTDRETTQLNPSYPLWIDTLEFHRQATTFLAGSLPDPADIKIELYQGDLLTDFYDDWILVEREGYQRLYLETLLRLTQAMRSQGEYQRAIELAERLLASDPAHEPAHQILMVCYLALGDRHAALKQYEACRRALYDELAVEPQPETTALYERIKHIPSLPPVATARLTNLPHPFTRFIGREHDVAEIKTLLLGKDELEAAVRLLTLTGPGGCGKTRLAIEIAYQVVDRFDDGAWWVELAPVADPAFVAQAVAKVLGLNEGPHQSLSETLVNYLRAKHLLLVLDNCEHLIIACAQLAQALLHAAPHLQILTTSREGLGISGERLWPVPSLSVPDPHQPLSLDKLNQSEAVRLFVDRAMAIRPDFKLTEQAMPAIAQICQHLAGIPLALELATGWVKVLTVEQMANRLADRLTLLSMGSRTALPRHQTLRGVLDWSFDLLTTAEQVLFRRLSIFAGGFTLAAAEAICAGEQPLREASQSRRPPMGRSGGVGESLEISAPLLDSLAQLVGKSLVLVEQSREEARYRLLEPVRQYGQDKLWLSGEETTLRRRHLRWFAGLAEQAEPELLGANQAVWLDRLVGEYANLSAALRWAAEGEPIDVAAGLRLGGALWRFWDLRGYIAEGRERLMQLLALPGAADSIEARARALFSAGMLALYQMDSLAAAALLEESLALWQATGSQRGLALALQHLGFIAHRQGHYATAHQRYEESLALWRAIGEEWGLTETLGMLGNLIYWEGDYARARSLQTESLLIKRRLGEKRGLAFSVWSLGKVAQAQGDYSAARSLYQEAISTMGQLEDKGGIPFVLESFGYLAVAEGQPRRAARLLGAAETLRQITGSALPVVSRADHEREVANIHHRLGEEAFATAWAEGRAMLLDRAVDYALSPDLANRHKKGLTKEKAKTNCKV